jgi:hypothetical protein
VQEGSRYVSELIRSGSSVSSRQMAYAAVNGLKVNLQWLSVDRSVAGYLVGMDDFHWMLVSTNSDIDSSDVVLVHKASPDLVIIIKEPSLASEPKYLQVIVEDVGRGFFSYCDKTFFGKN